MSLLKVKNLNISYPTRKETIVASQEVEFTLERGEILGIVGESGSGKSTIANAIINLIDPPGEITDGSIKIDNSELRDNEEVIQKIRGKKIGFVFQDPQTSLNPLFKIKDQLIETIQTHLDLDYQDALNRSIQLLEEVGIDNAEKRIEDYPHQFSGGMRQRVVIALAISCEPDLIIADEPTTALDVTQFSGAGQITAGAALTKSGNQMDVAVDNSSVEVNADALRAVSYTHLTLPTKA